MKQKRKGPARVATAIFAEAALASTAAFPVIVGLPYTARPQCQRPLVQIQQCGCSVCQPIGCRL